MVASKKVFRIIIVLLMLAAVIVWGAIMGMSFIRPYIMPGVFLTEKIYGTMREIAEVKYPNVSGFNADLSEAQILSGECTLNGVPVSNEDSELWWTMRPEQKIAGFDFITPQFPGTPTKAGVNVYDFYNDMKYMTSHSKVRREKSGDMGLNVKCYTAELDGERVRGTLPRIIRGIAQTERCERFREQLEETAARIENSRTSDKVTVKIWVTSDNLVKAMTEYRLDSQIITAWFDGMGGRIRNNIKFGFVSEGDCVKSFAASIMQKSDSLSISADYIDDGVLSEYRFSEFKYEDRTITEYRRDSDTGVMYISKNKDKWKIYIPYYRFTDDDGVKTVENMNIVFS